MATHPRQDTDDNGDKSDHSDVTTSSSDGPEPPAKRRTNTTYGHRRDEIRTLRKQVQRLEGTVKALEETPREPRLLANAISNNQVLHKTIEHQNLVLAGTQSMLSSYNARMHQDTGRIPLHTKIHLPRDPAIRTEILQSIRESMLQSTYRYMTERIRCLDLRRAQRQGEQFELDNGEAAESVFQVMHFSGGYNLRQVFNAFMFFMTHQEITVSENLGALTIRESEEMERSAFDVCQTRLLSTIPEGLVIESNQAMFASCDETVGHAIYMTDYIEQDDLNPWRPETCARKETTGAVLFTEVPSLSGRGERVVATTWWVHMRFRPPVFPLSATVETAVRENMMSWATLATKIMRERLKLERPAYERQL